MALDTQTYRNLAETRLRDIKSALFPDGDADIVVNVEILNGLHKGSNANLKASNLVIGPDTGHDIMLVDDEVLGSALNVRCNTSLFGTLLTLTTDRDDITLNGKPVRSHPHSITTRLPAELGINGISMRFSNPGSGQKVKTITSDKVAVGALVAVAVAAFTGQIYLDNQPERPSVALQQPPTEQKIAGMTSGATLASASADLAEEPQAAPAEPATVIQGQIETAGLAKFIEVTPTPSGIILISGQVPPAQMSQWKQVRQEIDRNTADNVVLADVTETETLTDLPPIAAVNLGTDPKVIFADGTVSRVGDRIVEDWVIGSIEEDKLQLRRDDEAIDVSF